MNKMYIHDKRTLNNPAMTEQRLRLPHEVVYCTSEFYNFFQFQNEFALSPLMNYNFEWNYSGINIVFENLYAERDNKLRIEAKFTKIGRFHCSSKRKMRLIVIARDSMMTMSILHSVLYWTEMKMRLRCSFATKPRPHKLVT